MSDDTIKRAREELAVMGAVLDALEPLTTPGRFRTLAAAAARFGFYDLARRALTAAENGRGGREHPMRWPVQFFHDPDPQEPETDTLCCLANDGTVWRRYVIPARQAENGSWYEATWRWRRAGLTFPPLPGENTP